jgi:enoyl-CoA hydratase/carnithine racemase
MAGRTGDEQQRANSAMRTARGCGSAVFLWLFTSSLPGRWPKCNTVSQPAAAGHLALARRPERGQLACRHGGRFGLNARSATTVPTRNEVLLRENLDGIAVLTLNRAAARNSLSVAMLEAMIEALAAIAADPAIRVVIIAADGPAFCAGHDLKELTARRTDADAGRAFFETVWKLCGTMMQAVIRLPQPAIACVQGTATAAGCQLVATCDLAVVSTAATFATPGVNIGLFCSTPMVALSRNVARKHAMEMLLTGDPISADEALRIGLVNRLTPPGAERGEAIRLAGQIAAKSASTIRIGKAAFYEQLEMGLAAAHEHASRVMVENMLGADAEEGIGAFLAKRKPN